MRMAIPVRIEKVKRAKYGAKATVVDGVRFDSVAEASRWGELRMLERSGEIYNLERQVTYSCTVNGELICKYLADFRYMLRPSNSNRGGMRVEDVKGMDTAVYRLKKRLVEALYPGTKIIEVRKIRSVRAA